MKLSIFCFARSAKALSGACVHRALDTFFTVFIKTVTLLVLSVSSLTFAGEGHDHNDIKNTAKSSPSDHSQGIALSERSMALAQIKVAPLQARTHNKTLYAPGELKANGYSSYIVSARTESVVIERHAMLGEHVNQGQPLVTLFSETMANAQADYLVAASEWQRVKQLDNRAVSESARLKAQSQYNASYGQLIALGLTTEAIDTISKDNIASFGQYSLVAQTSGVVLNDDFTQGQRVEAGQSIMTIADESSLWVEAKVAPYSDGAINKATAVSIVVNGRTYPAKVIQEAHVIDPTTRTRVIRLKVDNPQDKLHAGMFVDVHFTFASTTPILALPQSALMRGSDGDWQVFVQQSPGEFLPVEVELGERFGRYQQISGVPAGVNVAMTGAFFISSQLAKSGFDPHNH